MKSLKSLLIPFIVMVALVVVAIGVVISNAKEASTQETQAEAENVVSIGTNLVSSLEVVNRDGTGIGFQGSMDDQGMVIWSLMDKYDSDVPISNDAVSSWAYMILNFLSNGKIGDSSELNLAEYGLDNPAYTIIVTQYDGSVIQIYVGNKTADGGSCYFMVDGNPNVYTVVVAKYIYCGFQLIDFLASASLDIDYSLLSTVEFSRTSDSVDILATCELYETGDPMFTAISPFAIECSPYFATLIDKIVTMDITSFIDIPDDMLADYGLDEPAYSFVFTMSDGRIVTVDLSANINGYYYGKSNVVDGYFKISELQIDGLETQLMILLSSYLVYYPATEMSEINGTYGDQSFSFEISTSGSISAEDATAQLNSRNAKVFTSEGRSYAAILYESLITISVSGVDVEADPEFDPAIEFTYITRDYQTITLSFVERDNNSYYAFLNGEYTCFVVPARELFNNSGTDTFNYGAWTAYELAVEAIDNEISGIYDIPADEAAA